MSVRYVLAVLMVVAGLANAAPAEAQALKRFMHRVCVDFQRNNCWPEPFVRPDRYAVRAPFALMVTNGWRRQNMLAEYHFEEGTAELNESGRLKIRWILTEAPPHHRTVYVHGTKTDEKTEARIETVRQFAVNVVEKGQTPKVLPTSINAQGWPAGRIDQIDREWNKSTPAPRLREASSSEEEG